MFFYDDSFRRSSSSGCPHSETQCSFTFRSAASHFGPDDQKSVNAILPLIMNSLQEKKLFCCVMALNLVKEILEPYGMQARRSSQLMCAFWRTFLCVSIPGPGRAALLWMLQFVLVLKETAGGGVYRKYLWELLKLGNMLYRMTE